MAKEPVTCDAGIVDSHAHVMSEYFGEERDEVIARALDRGVRQILNPAVTVSDLPELIDLTERYEEIYAAIGQHPHEAKDWTEEHGRKVSEALSKEKIVAVGECGLDFYYNNSDRASQLRAFEDQVRIARRSDKPVIVHCRDAWDEVAEVLDRVFSDGAGGVRGVFHCFTGGPEELETMKEFDFYVSFSGIVTFKNAREIQEAARIVADDRILVETDCPFLAPQPVRGKRNEPVNVWWVVEKLAELRNQELSTVAGQCSDNTRNLFDLPAR